MVDFLLHFYRRGTRPFQSLSALPEASALSLMRKLYIQGSIFWERFEDPLGYLTFRREVEQNLRKGFIAKGGAPADLYPIYLVLGRPRWTIEALDPATAETSDEIQVPLSLFDVKDVSFTYPDSMVSAMCAAEKNPEYYEPDYHGKVFTLPEIAGIVEHKGLPGEGWQTRMPRHFAHYIEAQAWNHRLLDALVERAGRA